MHAYGILAAAAMPIMAVLAIAGIPVIASAESSATTAITLVPLDGETSLEETVIPMNIPLDNTSPWGAVTGEPSEHAKGHAVIIQFYQDGVMVHAAQVMPSDDGSYEYKFRVRNLDADTGEPVNIFSGDYAVQRHDTARPDF